MQMAQQQKTALITGANGGIGTATVSRLDELGWRVFAGVRTREAGAKLGRDLRRVVPVEMDITNEASIGHGVRQLASQLDGPALDALINLAGISADGPVELLTLDTLRHQFEVNVFGQVAVTQAALPLLRAAAGRIVNVGGAGGRLTLPMYGALSASKGALDSLTDALRMELKHQGVRVTYVEPGAVRTAFFQKSRALAQAGPHAGSEATQRIYSSAIEVATKAMIESPASPPEDVARAIVKALTSRRPAARYVVGGQARLGLRVLLRLPAPVRDRVMMSAVGLRRSSFHAAVG